MAKIGDWLTWLYGVANAAATWLTDLLLHLALQVWNAAVPYLDNRATFDESLAVMGIVIAIGFYLISQRPPSLSAAIWWFSDHRRAWVAEGRRTVTMSRVAVWNNGKVTVRREDITGSHPVSIASTGDGSRVLHATILVGTSRYGEPRVRVPDQGSCAEVDFDFLNPGEGIVAGIVHTGQDAGNLRVTGSLRGSGRFRTLNIDPFSVVFTRKGEDPVRKSRRRFRSVVVSDALLIFLAATGPWVLLQGNPPRLVIVLAAFMVLQYIAIGRRRWRRPLPPELGAILTQEPCPWSSP